MNLLLRYRTKFDCLPLKAENVVFIGAGIIKVDIEESPNCTTSSLQGLFTKQKRLFEIRLNNGNSFFFEGFLVRSRTECPYSASGAYPLTISMEMQITEMCICADYILSALQESHNRYDRERMEQRHEDYRHTA